jgi:hypothetical protein
MSGANEHQLQNAMGFVREWGLLEVHELYWSFEEELAPLWDGRTPLD